MQSVTEPQPTVSVGSLVAIVRALRVSKLMRNGTLWPGGCPMNKHISISYILGRHEQTLTGLLDNIADNLQDNSLVWVAFWMKANKYYVWGFQVLGESALLGFYKALFYKEQTCCLCSGPMFLRDNLLASLKLKKKKQKLNGKEW